MESMYQNVPMDRHETGFVNITRNPYRRKSYAFLFASTCYKSRLGMLEQTWRVLGVNAMIGLCTTKLMKKKATSTLKNRFQQFDADRSLRSYAKVLVHDKTYNSTQDLCNKL